MHTPPVGVDQPACTRAKKREYKAHASGWVFEICSLTSRQCLAMSILMSSHFINEVSSPQRRKPWKAKKNAAVIIALLWGTRNCMPSSLARSSGVVIGSRVRCVAPERAMPFIPLLRRDGCCSEYERPISRCRLLTTDMYTLTEASWSLWVRDAV